MGERGRQRILKDWNYERQFQPVLDLLNGVSSRQAEVPAAEAANRQAVAE
jgi:hypothetical protein